MSDTYTHSISVIHPDTGERLTREVTFDRRTCEVVNCGEVSRHPMQNRGLGDAMSRKITERTGRAPCGLCKAVEAIANVIPVPHKEVQHAVNY